MSKPDYLLSPIEAPRAAEIDHLPADGELLFMDIHAVNALRSAQHHILGQSIDHISSTHGGALGFADIEREAIKDCREAFDEVSVDFLKQFIAEDADNFSLYLTTLREFSIDKITDEEMAMGKVDPDTGERDEETAGYIVLEKKRRELSGESVTDDDTDPDKTARETRKATAEAAKAIADGDLDIARESLAKAEVHYRTKKMFGRKLAKNDEYEALKAAYQKASVEAAKAEFELMKATAAASEEAEPTAEQINHKAQALFAEEFNKFAEAQNNEAYFTEYGKKARKFGEVTVGKRLKRIATIAGIGALGMATGGIYAAAMFGTATALRIWQTKSAGTVGHSTKKGTDRITKKVNKSIVEDTKQVISANESTDTDVLASTIGSSHRSVAERTHKSNSRRRKMVPVLIGAALAGGVVKSMAEWNEKKDLIGNVNENIRDTDWKHPLREWNPFNHNEGVVEHTDTPTGGGIGPHGAPGAIEQIEAVKEVTPDDLTGLGGFDLSHVTPEQWRGLTTLSMRSAEGGTPWAKAMDYFGGDAQMTRQWLSEATMKAGGHWHNLGDGVDTNDWIMLADGKSDPDAVWKALTAAHPVPRP